MRASNVIYYLSVVITIAKMWSLKSINDVKITELSDNTGIFIGNWLSTKPEILKKYNIRFVMSIGGSNPVNNGIQNIQFMHVDIDDTPRAASKLNSTLQTLLSYIRQKNNEKQNCLIHCNSGISASVTVGVAYLIKYNKMSLRDAKTHILQRIPIACPNEGFCQVLEYFEERIVESQH
jgi:hypothetical protein